MYRERKIYERDNGLPKRGLNARLFRLAASSFARRFAPDEDPSESSRLNPRLESDSMEEKRPWFDCLGGQVCCVSRRKPGVAGDMAEKSKLKLKLYSESSSSSVLFFLEGVLALVGVLGLCSLTLLLGLMRRKFSIVSSRLAGCPERRFNVLLPWPIDDDNDEEDEDVDDCREPLTLARARGCMLFLRLAPPRGMIVLST